MKKEKALKIILINWALLYGEKGAKGAFYDLIDFTKDLKEPQHEIITDIEKAFLVWFGGTQNIPTEKFINTYESTMIHVYGYKINLMLGEITIEDIIIGNLIRRESYC